MGESSPSLGVPYVSEKHIVNYAVARDVQRSIDIQLCTGSRRSDADVAGAFFRIKRQYGAVHSERLKPRWIAPPAACRYGLAQVILRCMSRSQPTVQ